MTRDADGFPLATITRDPDWAADEDEDLLCEECGQPVCLLPRSSQWTHADDGTAQGMHCLA